MMACDSEKVQQDVTYVNTRKDSLYKTKDKGRHGKWSRKKAKQEHSVLESRLPGYRYAEVRVESATRTGSKPHIRREKERRIHRNRDRDSDFKHEQRKEGAGEVYRFAPPVHQIFICWPQRFKQ